MSRSKRVTWAKALALYETHLRAKRAATLTIKAYGRALDHLRERVDPLRPDQVKIADLREFQVGLLTGATSRSGKPLSASAVCKQTCGWRSFFAFLTEEGLLKGNPAARLEPPHVPRKAPGSILTVKQIERLLNAADTAPTGSRNRAVVEVLYSTALRRNEVCGLDLADLDHTERELRVQRGKGGNGRVVPLTRTAYLVLQNYLDLARPKLQSGHPDSCRALFLTRFGTRICEQTMRRLLLDLRARARLKAPVTPHVIRRTAATHLLKGGADLRTIQILLGHRSLNTTALYLRLDSQEIRRTILLKHPRERFA